MRTLGHILLWLGFISAALAAVFQHELDLLPEAEQTALRELEMESSISQYDLEELTDKTIVELSSNEFLGLLESAKPIMEARKEAEKKAAAEAAAKAQEESKEREPEEEPELSEDEKLILRKKAKAIGKYDFIKRRSLGVENRWPAVNWLWFGLSMAVGIAGVVLLRKTAQSEAANEGKVEENYAIVNKMARFLRDSVAKLDREVASLAPQQIVDRIDDEFSPAFNDFAEARKSMIQRFDLQTYADVMTQFASGERFMNRAWSAAADGYMDEVEDCVRRANGYLSEVVRLLEENEKGTKV